MNKQVSSNIMSLVLLNKLITQRIDNASWISRLRSYPTRQRSKLDAGLKILSQAFHVAHVDHTEDNKGSNRRTIGGLSAPPKLGW